MHLKGGYMRSRVGGVAGVAILFSMVFAPLGATTIDTTFPAWDTSSSVSTFGRPNSATYGQTVTVPVVDLTLVEMQMAFDGLNQVAVSFRPYLYDWDGTKATGPALWTGPLETADTTAGYQTFTWVPNVTGVAGDTWVFFVSTSADSGPDAGGKWAQPQNQNLYAGGAFVFINNGSDPSGWTTDPWTQNFLGSGADMTFSATWQQEPGTPIPEASTWIMCVSAGILTLILYRRRRLVSV